jgi:hypothetical protein
MTRRKPFVSSRSLRTLLGITVSSSVLGVACNAMLGIDEGHLVTKKNDGAGGSSSVDAGAGGSSMQMDASSMGGSTGDGGSGGRATGGTTESGGSDAGTGGTTGAGGTGTGGRGGATGSGGAATGGSDSVQKPPDVAGQVHCGDTSCKLSSGQVCCVETTTGNAHCAVSCDSTSQLPVSCDGAEDCSGGKKCCYPTGGTTASCMASCLGRVFCGSDRDCAAGQRCAPGTGALATVFVCIAVPKAKTVWCGGEVCDVGVGNVCCYDKTSKTEQCAKTCPSTNTVRFACDGAEDCASGSSCCEARTGVGVFTGTDCVAGGCPSGAPELTCGAANGCSSSEQCCLAATGSSCSASCSDQIACGTDADCPTGQSCTVLTDAAIGKTPGVSVCTTTP